eukprot:scaffold3667_cov110-Isochrysis_galbana.AAC.8
MGSTCQAGRGLTQERGASQERGRLEEAGGGGARCSSLPSASARERTWRCAESPAEIGVGAQHCAAVPRGLCLGRRWAAHS